MIFTDTPTNPVEGIPGEKEIDKCDIKAGYRSDHSIISMDMVFNNFSIGKGIWKFNNSLLKNKDYLKLINEIIEDEKLKYAVPVYQIQFLNNNFNNIMFTVDNETFLELLILRIRGETINFTSCLKKQTDKKEKELLKDIEYLESPTNTSNPNLQLLSDKKVELQKIREYKIKGQQLRNKMQWLSEGEKPTRYFCNLENKHFIEKTIKKLQILDGHFITDQKEILNNIRNFYASLFKNRDSTLESVILTDILPNVNLGKVCDPTLGAPLQLEELGIVLKNMKNNKSPGIDGITAEFLKVFWGKLKFFICNALNSCFHKGKLSTSLCQCLITCIPKGKKDRRLIKNWRPISLLSVIYKLASGTIQIEENSSHNHLRNSNRIHQWQNDL